MVHFMCMVQDSNYHRVLRISSVVCAAVLLFESGLLSSSTAALSQNTHRYLANSISTAASFESGIVAPELTAQRNSSGEIVSTPSESEVGTVFSESTAPNQRATYIIAGLLFILLTLVVLNYALDYLKKREQKLSPAT